MSIKTSADLIQKYLNRKIIIKIDGRNGSAVLVENMPSKQFALANIVWSDAISLTPESYAITLTEDMALNLQEIDGELILIYNNK